MRCRIGSARKAVLNPAKESWPVASREQQEGRDTIFSKTVQISKKREWVPVSVKSGGDHEGRG